MALTEIKFDRVIKEGFQPLLKPLGFKKKANNFYLQEKDLGKLINIQKSTLYSKQHIHFTINIGIFLAEYWNGLLYNQKNELPNFPEITECLIRERIGTLKAQQDIWYDIEEKTDEDKLIAEMKLNISEYILPYFNLTKTKEDMLKLLDLENRFIQPLDKLIVYAELKQFDKANQIFQTLVETNTNPVFLLTVNEYGKKYGLE